MYVGTNGTSGTYEKTLRKKKSVEEERTLVKSGDSIQKKNSFTKVKETRKCSLNGGVKASDHDQVSIDEVILSQTLIILVSEWSRIHNLQRTFPHSQ